MLSQKLMNLYHLAVAGHHLYDTVYYAVCYVDQGKVTQISSHAQYSRALESATNENKLVVIDFFADWYDLACCF